MVSQEIINDCITKCREYGNAISVIPCNEVMLKSTNDVYSDLCVPRDNLKRTQTPQAVLFKQFLELHQEAKEKGITASIATASLLTELGHRVYYSLGSEKNIKLTTPDDLDIFKALLHSKRSDWIHA
jgi:2-C-methyl-D-erythritol 4-phosphate cytidylyltransferase